MANCTDLTEQVTPDTASVSQSRTLTGLVIQCDLLTCDGSLRHPTSAGLAGLPVPSGLLYTDEKQP